MSGGSSQDRAAAIVRFLADNGWGEAVRRPLAADWSTRRYERLIRRGSSAILMDAPEPWTPQVPAFARLSELLRGVGLSAPEVLAVAPEQGLLLCEDFGDTLFAHLLDGGGTPEPLYAAATDVLIHLHRSFDGRSASDLPVWDVDRFAGQVDLFANAFVPGATGRRLAPESAATLRRAWLAVLPVAYKVPQSLMLRDYFPGNLMWLGGRTGIRRCGILDFQDGGVGPVSYDLLSLLEDARRDVPADLKATMIARYLAAFPEVDAEDFATSFAVLGAIRHARILGRIAELAANGATRLLAFLPRVWGQFAEKLADPALLPLQEWALAHLPEDGGLDRISGGAAE